MSIYPPALERLIRELTRLPGIGPKSAARIALFILNREKDLAVQLAQSLLDVKAQIHFCSTCFNLTDSDLCPICSDPGRANGLICVVEGPGDQLAIEESGSYRGRYHILHGVLAPLDGIGPRDLKIGELLRRLEPEQVTEIILATNPTTEGEATAAFLRDLLSGQAPQVTVTRIALGVPMGGDLKYMDPMTLQHALKSRNLLET